MKIKIMPILFVVFLLSGCGPARIQLKSSFWQTKEAKIGVAVVKYPQAEAYREGGQGLLDMAINEALADKMSLHLKRLKPEGFLKVVDVFVERLQEGGMSAKKIDGLIDLEQYEKFDKGTMSGNYALKDMRSLAEKEKINMLILFSIERFGTIRKYYGFIPLGAPSALCEVKGQMINLDNNELQWQCVMDQKQAMIPVIGNWDQPPNYPNLTESIKQTISQAIMFEEKEFFGNATQFILDTPVTINSESVNGVTPVTESEDTQTGTISAQENISDDPTKIYGVTPVKVEETK